MDVVILCDFLGRFDQSLNSRFLYLANILKEKHEVEIITGDFDHGSKEYFKETPKGFSYKITMLHEPKYPRNICLQRFYSHFIWGKKVKKYLDNRKKPDVIYCAMPTLTAAYEAGKYCKKKGVRFIVDIQDLWPEAFEMVFRVPVLSNIIYAPFHAIANGAYKRADFVCAVSDTYLNRGLSVNKKCKEGKCVFLGTKLEDFDTNVKNFSITSINIQLPHKSESDLWLAYCGTLGSSYDLICVFDALEILKNKGIKPPTFIIMGDGPRRTEFEQYALQKKLNVIFTGSLPYTQMCGLLCMCDITINPIVRGSAGSIINKHGDYAASGLPVINTQESIEYRKLVEAYNMGLNSNNSDAVDLAEKLILVIKDKCLRENMGRNARRCAEEKFDRKYTYQQIVDVIIKQE